MTNGTLDSLWLYSYEDFFLLDVHSLLFSGYEAARDRIHSHCEEDVITGFLTETLKVQVRKPEYFGRYQVEEQRPVNSVNRTGKRRQQIDLVFEANDPAQVREFCCEAKRLKTSSNSIGDYTGAEGMGCFINCEYASDQPVAAMIGYVQSSSMDYWHGELKRSLDGQTNLNVQTALAEKSVVSELPYEWLSVHKRTNGENVDVYHIFLDCS